MANLDHNSIIGDIFNLEKSKNDQLRRKNVTAIRLVLMYATPKRRKMSSTNTKKATMSPQKRDHNSIIVDTFDPKKSKDELKKYQKSDNFDTKT